MAFPDLAFDNLAIVIKGVFSPGMFSPSWLLMQNLIGPPEIDSAEVNVIAQDIASFRAGWLDIQVTQDGLQISTSDQEEFDRLRDLAVGILNTLQHVPVAALGINRNVHFGLGSSDKWHAFGDLVTPKDFWGSFLNLAGMKSVTMWGARGDLYTGQIQVIVEPSSSVPSGIYVAHNDHFNLTTIDEPVKSRDQILLDVSKLGEPTVDKNRVAVQILDKEWGLAMGRTKVAIRSIAERAGDL